MNINAEKDSNRTVLINQPGAVKHKNISEETELYLFRIPKGLFSLKDLVNKEINIEKKASKVTINGNKFDFIVQPLDGQENAIKPWISNNKAVLKPASVAVTAEVRVRVHLSKPSVMDSLQGLEQFAPTVHSPPDLPSRDFFASRCGDLNRADEPVPTLKNSKKKSKRKSLAAAPTGGGDLSSTPMTNEACAAARKKRSFRLEHLTPEVSQKPFKKKKQDKLVASFKGVYEDICATPAVGSASKKSNGR